MNAPRTLRDAAVLAHRVVGLALASFLVVAGGTGAVLAFMHELEAVLHPELFTVSRAQTTRDDAAGVTFELARLPALEAETPGAVVRSVPLWAPAGESIRVYVDGAPGGDDEIFVDPRTGAVLGARRWGDLGQGTVNLLPFLYKLHYGLALGDVGGRIMGVVALLWCLDCFVGAFLTLPPRRRRAEMTTGARLRAWTLSWAKAWLVKTASLASLLFSFHRAAGLWLWGMLFVFAWSAVGMNLREVYNPVMRATLSLHESAFDRLPKAPSPRPTPVLSFAAARAHAQRHLQRAAQQRGVTLLEERRISYDVARGLYALNVRSSADITDRYVGTSVWVDGDSGALVAVEFPTGESVGGTVHTWMMQLHFGAIRVGGLPYRVFVSLCGVAVVLLSGSGVWIWWTKRQKRRAP